MTGHCRLVAIALGTLTALTTPAAAQNAYRVYDLGVGGAFDLNNNATVQIAGYLGSGSPTGASTATVFNFMPDASGNGFGTVTPVALTFGAAGTHNEAQGINAGGQVVGFSSVANTNANTNTYAPTVSTAYYVGSGTTGTALAAPPVGTASGEVANSGGTRAYGISNTGQIVGYSIYTDSDGTTPASFSSNRGFYTANQGGNYTLLQNGTGGNNSPAYRINSAGQIVGTSDNATQFFASRFSTNGSINATATSPVAGSSPSSFGLAINANSVIVGSASGDTSGAGSHAIMFNGTTTTDLGNLPGGSSAEALGINDNNTIVGSDNGDAWVRPAGATSLIDLNTGVSLLGLPTGFHLDSAEGINDQGDIVGLADIGGVQHAFLLQPVPEPATWMMCGAVAASALGYAGRKRRQWRIKMA